MDPKYFFPERGQHVLANKAILTCLYCPVMDECEDYRRRTDTQHGVWGGTYYTRKEVSENP